MRKNLKRLFSMILVIPILGSTFSSSISATTSNTPLNYTHFGIDSTYNDSWSALGGNTKVAGSVNGVSGKIDLSYDMAEDAITAVCQANNSMDLYFNSNYIPSSGASCTFAILLKTDLTTNIFGTASWIYSMTSGANSMGTMSYDTESKSGYTIAYLTTNITTSSGVKGIRVSTKDTTYTLYSCGLFASEDAAKAYYASYDAVAPTFSSENISCQANGNTLTVELNATDNVTASENISYSIYASETAITIDNYKDAAYSTTVTGGTSATLTGLAGETNYYLAIVAKDENGKGKFMTSQQTFYTAEAVVNTPLALMHATSDDENGIKQSGVTTTAKGGTVWAGGDIDASALTVAYDTTKQGVKVESTASGAWTGVWLDRAYAVKETDSFYVAVLYEGDAAGTVFSTTKGYSYRDNSSFLPITDGTARLDWQYDHAITNALDGKTYSLAYAKVTDAVEDIEIYGMQISINANTNYYFHSAGVFRELEDAKAYYSSFVKTSQKDEENWSELLAPIWEGDTVYEEFVMVITESDGTISPISLAYPIDEIVCVQDAVKSITYKAGRDYSLVDGKLVINPATSSVPITEYDKMYFTESGDNRATLKSDTSKYVYWTEGDFWHFRQIVVTYKHSGEWKGDVPEGQAENLSKTIAKLENKDALNIVVNGYSCTTGCSCSGFLNIQPFLPNYADTVTQQLKSTYSNENITMTNTAVGGKDTTWCLENIQTNILDYDPDLVILEMGLNDSSLTTFTRNMTSIVDKLMEDSELELILVGSNHCNSDLRSFYAYQDSYLAVLKQLAAKYEGRIAVADLTSIHGYLLTIKNYTDMTCNNVNHNNDFIERIYTQIIMKTFEGASDDSAENAPLAYAEFTSGDVGGSVADSSSTVATKGSLYIGGNSGNGGNMSYDATVGGIKVNMTSNNWLGVQFDEYYTTTDEPFYMAMLYAVDNNTFTRLANDYGYLYKNWAGKTSFQLLYTSAKTGRVQWRYDYICSDGSVDYFMAYARVTDVAAGVVINGMQTPMVADTNYYVCKAGLFDTYGDAVAALYHENASRVALQAENNLGGNTVITSNTTQVGIAEEVIHNSSSITAVRNNTHNGVTVTASGADAWIAINLDKELTLEANKQYTFAILTNSDIAPASGYYTNNYTKGVYNNGDRPTFSTETVTIDGTNYYLHTAVLSMNSASGFSAGDKIYGIRFTLASGKSYSVYGLAVLDDKSAAKPYVRGSGFLTGVDYHSATDKATTPSVYAKFDAKDVGGLKPSGTYMAASGSLWLGGDTEGTLEYDTTYKAIHGYSTTSGAWLGIQFDSHYVVRENTPYYVAILYTTDNSSFKKLDAYAGYSFYDYRFEDSFTLYKDADGNYAGRLQWSYRYVDTVDGKDRYVAYALVEDVAATTTVLHSRTGLEEQGTTEITGIQVPFKTDVNYYLYSAGIFEDYDSVLYTLTDSTAPVIHAQPTFTVEDSKITVNLEEAGATDNLIADSKLIYKLYMSTEPIAEETELTIPASVTFGDADAVLEYLEYGAGYYFALEVLDEAGNVATWIGEDKIRTQVKQGDTNADTYINESDLLTVRQKLLGKIENFNSDVNEDTNVNVKDLVALKKIEDNVLTFGELGLTRPNVVNGADVVFGTYQNMEQLVEHPESWTFSQMHGDGVLLHEAYWLHDWSPQSTTGEALSNILNARENLKVYLEYGMPKESTCITTDEETGEVTGILANDDGTTWGTNNYSIFKNKVDTFIANTGINIDVLNLEFYSNAVYNALRGLNLGTNWNNHEQGVEYTLKAYDSFYSAFVADESYKDMKINHVGCPNLTALWGGKNSTYPRYWKESEVAGNYGEGSYWGSYQACDITLPILSAERTDDRHIGYVSDSPWNSFDTGKLSNGEQNQVIKETITALEDLNKNLNSSLIVGDWDDSFNTDETITDEQIDKFFWENSLKSIFNAQYNDAYHSAYFIESYWDGPYTMLSEDEKYSYANLVATAIKYLKGIGQDLDLTISDGTTTKGSGEYGNTPMKSQLFEKTEDEKTYTVTITNNGEFVCNPWLRAVKSVGDNDATITYKYNGEDITSQITSADGFTFKDLFEKDGKFDSYTESTDAVLDTDFDNENHGLEVGASVTIQITVSGGNDGAVALCGFYNPQDSTNTIKDVVTITY